jgi:hypothetical protein
MSRRFWVGADFKEWVGYEDVDLYWTLRLYVSLRSHSSPWKVVQKNTSPRTSWTSRWTRCISPPLVSLVVDGHHHNSIWGLHCKTCSRNSIVCHCPHQRFCFGTVTAKWCHCVGLNLEGPACTGPNRLTRAIYRSKQKRCSVCEMYAVEHCASGGRRSPSELTVTANDHRYLRLRSCCWSFGWTAEQVLEKTQRSFSAKLEIRLGQQVAAARRGHRRWADKRCTSK